MRILRLTMDAVGPFPGHEVIDFEAFSDAGHKEQTQLHQ